jgi:hypothetical protein
MLEMMAYGAPRMKCPEGALENESFNTPTGVVLVERANAL